MGSCVGKKHNEQTYIECESHKHSPIRPGTPLASKEDMEAFNFRTRIVTT